MASNSPTATTLLRPCDGTPVETCTHFAAADISWTCAGRPATSVCQRPQVLPAGFLSRVLAREGESLALRLPHAALEAAGGRRAKRRAASRARRQLVAPCFGLERGRGCCRTCGRAGRWLLRPRPARASCWSMVVPRSFGLWSLATASSACHRSWTGTCASWVCCTVRAGPEALVHWLLEHGCPGCAPLTARRRRRRCRAQLTARRAAAAAAALSSQLAAAAVAPTAVVVGLGGLWVVVSPAASIMDDRFFGYSDESQLFIAIALGYFVWDLAACIRHGWDAGFIVHGERAALPADVHVARQARGAGRSQRGCVSLSAQLWHV